MTSIINVSRPMTQVKNLAFGGADAIAASLSNDLVPLVDLNAEKIKRTYDVAKKIAGVHFSFSGTPVLRAVDDSFGVHVFDLRSDSKKKLRLNPDVESHEVKCSAISENYIAIGSSSFFQGQTKTKKKKYREEVSDSEDGQFAHVISIFDTRNPTSVVMSLGRYHKAPITCMSFDRTGTILVSADASGQIHLFDLERRGKPHLKPVKDLNKSVYLDGFLSKKIHFGVTTDNVCHVYFDNEGAEEELFSKEFPESEKIILVTKGTSDDYPVHTIFSDPHGKMRLRQISQSGHKTAILDEWEGHDRQACCAAFNVGIVVTGGDDGRLVARRLELRQPGKSKKTKKEKKHKRQKKSSDTEEDDDEDRADDE